MRLSLPACRKAEIGVPQLFSQSTLKQKISLEEVQAT